MRFSFFSAFLALALGQPALAHLTWGFSYVDKGDLLPGYITRDLVVTTDSEWWGAELLITLDNGSFYQHPYGGLGPPESGVISHFPELEFDTYLTGGTPDDDPGGRTCCGAADLGGTPGLGYCQFDESEIDVTWYRMQTPLVGDLMVARLTLSSDASGSWKLRISNQDEGARTITGEACTILNGQFGILGDLSGDGFVGGDDLDIVRSYWGQNVPPGLFIMGHPSGDGFVGGDDLDIIRTYWGDGGGSIVPWPDGVPDLNSDTWVNTEDLGIVEWNWGEHVNPGDLLHGDATGDGFVGDDDFHVVIHYFGTIWPPTPVVPEPSTLVLLGWAGFGVVVFLKRKWER